MEETNEKKWSVYIHINKINNKVYVGIAQHIKSRWGHCGNGYKTKNQDGQYDQPIFARALDKYKDWDNDWEHKILFDGLTHEEAKQKEVELISFYKSNACKWRDEAMGYNMTDGGEGTTGRQFSKETLEKMSCKKKEYMSNPEVNPMYGKHHSEETKNKISETLKDIFSNPENHPMYGKSHSENSREKMKESSKRRWTDDARLVVSEYKNQYFSDPDNQEKAEETRRKMREASRKRWLATSKKVVQLTMGDIYVAEYTSAPEASRQTNINQNSIYGCCKRRIKSAGGFKWMYKEDYDKLTQQND